MLNAVVDISHHNASVNFAAAAHDGLVGVFHKATQGVTDVDPCYAARKPEAQAAGLLWGAYHFGVGEDGAAQAAHFLQAARPNPQVLVMLDFEPNTQGPSMTADQAEQFVTAIYQATGRYPGLYSTNDFLIETGAEHSTILQQCWLWVAAYEAVSEPVHPPAWRTWTMWQYTDGTHGLAPHEAPGIGPCDRDQFNGELAGLQVLWGVSNS